MTKIFVPLIFFLGFILWVWALIDIVRNSRGSKEPLALWIFIVVLFPLIGPFVYFRVGRNRIRQKKTFDPQFNRY